MTSSTRGGLPLRVHVLRVDAQALGERDAVLLQPLAHLPGGGEGVLGGDVVAVGAQPAEVGRARGDELGPPLAQVRRDLDADAGQQPLGLADQALEVVERDRGRPLRAGPRAGGRRCPSATAGRRPRRRSPPAPAVVALVRDEVLEDDLLDVVEAGQRLQRRDALVLGLPDADEDPAGERDPQLAGGADRRQARLRVLGRRALVGDEVRVDGLEHQPLGRGHLAQPGEVGRGRARRGSCAAAGRGPAPRRTPTRRRRRSPRSPARRASPARPGGGRAPRR